MSKDELKRIMDMLCAYYPNQNFKDMKTVLKAWYTILKDYTYEEAEKAVTSFVSNDQRDYPVFPHIGKIVQLMEKERHKYKF